MPSSSDEVRASKLAGFANFSRIFRSGGPKLPNLCVLGQMPVVWRHTHPSESSTLAKIDPGLLAKMSPGCAAEWRVRFVPSDSRNASRPSLAYQSPSPDGRFGFHVSGGQRESKSKDHRSLALIAASSDSPPGDRSRPGARQSTPGGHRARQGRPPARPSLRGGSRSPRPVSPGVCAEMVRRCGRCDSGAEGG